MEILGSDQRKTIEFDSLHVMDRLIVVIALTQGKSLVFFFDFAQSSHERPGDLKSRLNQTHATS